MGVLIVIGWIVLGTVIGFVCAGALCRYFTRQRDATLASALIRKHFNPVPLDNITISERSFPFRVRADLQRGLDQLFTSGTRIVHFCGIHSEYGHRGISISHCMASQRYDDAITVPPKYEEVDVGDERPVRCLKNALWLLEKEGVKFAVLLAPAEDYGRITGIQFEVATANDEQGTQVTQEFFRHLETSVLKAESYRGKILSLELSQHLYSGAATGIKVHKLRTVDRDQVILPQTTLDLLDRNVIGFVQQRQQLSKLKQATKKGLLFYGPPGTGKTHTIHYLAKALAEHTTLLITAEQISLLTEYMALARLLQPSIVIMEDVDLIAQERSMLGTCEEAILNKLLNEMDGLNEEADILFILTTNRPEVLEQALASRPGRVDQAIEFPLPDDIGRSKLVRLYSQGLSLSDEIVAEIVARTDAVSAAFIKELMRRSVQFHLESDGQAAAHDNGSLQLRDVENALEEMLFSGGSLNLKLLGGDQRRIGFSK